MGVSKVQGPSYCRTPTHCSIQNQNPHTKSIQLCIFLLFLLAATPRELEFTHQAKCRDLGSLAVKPYKNPIRIPLTTSRRRMMEKFGLDHVSQQETPPPPITHSLLWPRMWVAADILTATHLTPGLDRVPAPPSLASSEEEPKTEKLPWLMWPHLPSSSLSNALSWWQVQSTSGGFPTSLGPCGSWIRPRGQGSGTQ